MSIERTVRVAAAAGLALFAIIGAVVGDRPLGVGLAVAAAIAILAAIAAWRRTTGWPLVALLAPPVAGIVVLAGQSSSNLAWMGFCVIAAWVALTSAVRVSAVATLVLVVIVVAEWVARGDPAWAAWLVGTALTAVACLLTRQQRLTMDQLREAQHQLAERSRAEERSRIAAEVHDLLGHALTVSLLHIGSARLMLDEEPAEARQALEDAERLTRASLDEVRASVGLMRGESATGRTPLPDARAVPELVESFRRAGATVDLTIDGDLATLGQTRGLAVYRIVQEALTNAARHAGGQPVSVRIGVAADRTTVSVCNGGDVLGQVVPGSGLASMRDRAESLGGRFRAGVLEGAAGRGWQVEAELPT